MNTQAHEIRSWRELASAFLMACELSDPSTAQPNGVVTFDRIGDTGIVKMTINIDLVPVALIKRTIIPVVEDDIPF